MFTKKHFKLTKIAAQVSAVAVAALFGTQAYAAGAVSVTSSWTGSDNSLDGGSTAITATGIGNQNGYTDNPALNNSAWGHAGTWFVFENTLGGSDVSVSVNGAAGFVPGVTVWATDGAFDGGTTGFGGEVPSGTVFSGTPHVFNGTGAQGDAGTLWMQDGQGGNVLETLGYAVSNPAINVASAAWGESVLAGAHDVSVSNTFESGVTGITSASSATLDFDNLAAGWYAVYVGGTDSLSAGGGYDLVVSAVPEAETWAMLLAGLGLIGWRLRSQSREVESGMIPAA
ncbi:PEP-CTERM sorting domain-containing protein [Nitrosomonas sp.]|uniref:PEP-CTERM sorting domain-containing protein n=1 Tax=Nitrosomonas sp. TaxID=42353 RepID=UPI00283AE73A|nr:PEP-CTERM sorting domain-containing protein [Nitrosomonas sp.]MDR4513096.1 PEP-CTERM sorting domain-containing protein [Nitrosomonas sp.]